jgi:predicted RNA polymerase sigma factor
MAFGPEAGLALVDAIEQAEALRDYAPLPAAKGDFLFRMGRMVEARRQFEHAAALTRNERERAFLLKRASACSLMLPRGMQARLNARTWKTNSP